MVLDLFFQNTHADSDSQYKPQVEMEMRELLNEYGFKGDDTPIILGSALCALEDRNPEIGVESIRKLMAAVDSYIPTPKRDLEKPFLMSIEDVFSIAGRGTVATGSVERGFITKGAEVEVVGFGTTLKTTITGVEMFHKEHPAGTSRLNTLKMQNLNT